MDMSYEIALRNATRAWSHNRTTDAASLRTLQRHAHGQQFQPANQPATPAPTDQAAQPTLARFGNLGTRLNVFA
jgi:hypothetical protein